jgi:hypothetical protein
VYGAIPPLARAVPRETGVNVPVDTFVIAAGAVIFKAAIAGVTVTVVVPLLNPVKVAVTPIVPAPVGFTDLVTIPAASVVPLVTTPAPFRDTDAPLAGVFTFLTLLDLLTVKVTAVGDKAGTDVGTATNDRENVGDPVWPQELHEGPPFEV